MSVIWIPIQPNCIKKLHLQKNQEIVLYIYIYYIEDYIGFLQCNSPASLFLRIGTEIFIDDMIEKVGFALK